MKYISVIILVSNFALANDALDKELENLSIKAVEQEEEFEVINNEPITETEEIIYETKDEIDSVTKFDENFYQFAIVRLINKITASNTIIKLKVKSTYKANNHLEIRADYCWKAPAYKEPENKSYLKVTEISIDQAKKKNIFEGWLFSSSPSVSDLQHPIYDIHLIRCE
jgi:hypothetical protein